MPMGYGVIGNTTVSGTVILGSSPGRPATELLKFCVLMPRSSSGLGRRPLTAVTRVQIPYGVQRKTSDPAHGSEVFRFRYCERMVWKLSSLFSGEIRQSGSSLIDAFSVPAAASSLSSSIPLLAVPALFLATLGGGVFGAPLYEGSAASGSSIGNGSEVEIALEL